MESEQDTTRPNDNNADGDENDVEDDKNDVEDDEDDEDYDACTDDMEVLVNFAVVGNNLLSPVANMVAAADGARSFSKMIAKMAIDYGEHDMASLLGKTMQRARFYADIIEELADMAHIDISTYVASDRECANKGQFVRSW